MPVEHGIFDITDIKEAFNRAFDKLVREHFPLGTKTRAMDKREVAWRLFATELQGGNKNV